MHGTGLTGGGGLQHRDFHIAHGQPLQPWPAPGDTIGGQRAERTQDVGHPSAPRRADGEDPDIAGIVPGPQPHPFLEDDELLEDEQEQDPS